MALDLDLLRRRILAWASAVVLPWMGYYALAALELERLVTHECPVLAWERALLGGRSAPELLAPVMELQAVNLLMIATYISFYAFLLGLPAWLLIREARAAFRRLRLSWAVAAVTGYTLYFLTPTRSPYYQLEIYHQPPFLLADSIIAMASRAGVVFRYDAFPSMHVAFALLAVLATRTVLGTSGRLMLRLWFGALVLATMATGSHYLLDLVAGITLAMMVWLATGSASAEAEPG